MVTRAISDIQTIADVFSQGFLEILGDVLKLIVVIVVMFVADWRLTLISLSTIPVLLFATYIFKNGNSRRSENSIRSDNQIIFSIAVQVCHLHRIGLI